jgi:hypothetical protein
VVVSSQLFIIQFVWLFLGKWMPSRSNMVSSLNSGKPSWYLLTAMWASKPGLALLLGMGCEAALQPVFSSQDLHAYFL